MLSGERRDAALFVDIIDLANRSESGGGRDMPIGERPISRDQIKLWFALAIMFILGVLGVLVADQLPWPWAQHLLKELSGALFTAAFLGFTVDRAAKIELIRDAFYAAFRYILPPELKEEVARIINYKFLCLKCLVVIKLEPIAGTELVRVRIKVERDIKNITRHTESMPNILSLDDWGHPGQSSEVVLCTLQIDGGNVEQGEDTIEEKRTHPYVRQKSTKEIKLPSQSVARATSHGFEIKRNNDELNLYFHAPTVTPEVLVETPETLAHLCSFGVPGETVITSTITKKYTLDGTQFPGQRIHLRWWPAPEKDS